MARGRGRNDKGRASVDPWAPQPPPSALRPGRPVDLNLDWRVHEFVPYPLRCAGNGLPGGERRWAQGCEQSIPPGQPFATRAAPHHTKHCERCMNAFFRDVITAKMMTREELISAKKTRLQLYRQSLAQAVGTWVPGSGTIAVDPAAVEYMLGYCEELEALVRTLRGAMRTTAEGLSHQARVLSQEAERLP